MRPAKKILVIEDEPDFRLALRTRLEANGYGVIEAQDGLTGLDLVRQQAPDLIILDVLLPKLNGFSVARLIKYDGQFRHIPLMILTVLAQAADRQMGQAAGADAYMTKPYQPQELLNTISSLVAPGLPA